MTLIEAKEIMLELIKEQIGKEHFNAHINISSPDRDDGKFYLLNKPARIIAPFDGFRVNINLNWFGGSEEPPKIKGGPFHWVIFPVCANGKNITHYHICNYKKLRLWTLKNILPVENNHRDHNNWRGNIRILRNNTGYFQWGDEPQHDESLQDRIIILNNIEEIINVKTIPIEFYDSDLDEKINQSLELNKDQRLARLATANKKPQSVVVQSKNYIRNADVIVEVLERAKGICEHCQNPAPFKRRSDGTPYLELHHVIQLAAGGNDSIENAIALCPNCHRKSHFG